MEGSSGTDFCLPGETEDNSKRISEVYCGLFFLMNFQIFSSSENNVSGILRGITLHLQIALGIIAIFIPLIRLI